MCQCQEPAGRLGFYFDEGMASGPATTASTNNWLSAIGGGATGALLLIGALIVYALLNGPAAKDRRAAIGEERARHRKELARIKREHPRL